jgi:lipopolysaccharide export system permease protein
MFIFEMQFIWVYLDDMVGKGLELSVIMKLLLYASARIVNMALPLAILMSSIMTMGALSENNELTAMKSAGVPLTRILRPLIVFHLLLSIGAFAFANNVWPIANLKFRTLLYGIMQQRPALSLDNGVFYSGIEGISIRVSNKDPKTGELSDVLIYDHRDKSKGNRTVVRAQKGVMEQTEDKRFLVMTLFNGYSYDEPTDRKRKQSEQTMIESHFEKSVLRLDLSSFAFQANNEEVFKNSYEMMTINQLDSTIDSLEVQYDSTLNRLSRSSLDQYHLNKPAVVSAEGASLAADMSDNDRTSALQIAQEITRRNKDGLSARQDELDARQKFLARHKIEWHRKFYLAIVCVVLFFIGAPLGAIIRKGGLGMPTVIALALFIFYQLLTIAGEKMTKSMIIDAWLGMWMSTAVLLPLSIWLTIKASKEAVLMDKDNYTRLLKKVSALWKRNAKQTPA